MFSCLFVIVVIIIIVLVVIIKIIVVIVVVLLVLVVISVVLCPSIELRSHKLRVVIFLSFSWSNLRAPTPRSNPFKGPLKGLPTGAPQAVPWRSSQCYRSWLW